MDRPSKCKWCGCGDIWIAKMGVILWECGSSWESSNNRWESANKCREACLLQVEQYRDRIRRALQKIKASKRWSAEKNAKTPIEYHPDPDGWIAQASDLDDVARILEGDADA